MKPDRRSLIICLALLVAAVVTSGLLRRDRHSEARPLSATPLADMPSALVTSNRIADRRGVGAELNKATAQPLESEEALLERIAPEGLNGSFDRLVAAQTPEPERAELMADLMARSDPERLPYLVHISSLEDYPFRPDALAVLESILGANYGTNTIGWADAVKGHLERQSGVSGVEVLLSPLAGDGDEGSL